MDAKKVTVANRIRAIGTIVTLGVLTYALWVSRGHIEHVGYVLGLSDFEARTLFVIIDIPVIIGKLFAGPWFAPTTRREARRLMVTFVLASLALNVTSGFLGGGIGAAAYGALIVFIALWMERLLTKVRPAASVTRAKSDAAKATQTTRRRRAATRRPAKMAKTPALPVPVLNHAEE